MKKSSFYSNNESQGFQEISGGGEEINQPVQNVMIPIELDTRNQIVGFFALENNELPLGGQTNLNEITGTPFKPEIAGLTVFVGPVIPDMQDNYIKALITLADSVDRCDRTSHSRNTAFWAKRSAEFMNLSKDEVEEITLAGRLHDVGKALIPKTILSNPGPLDQQEWTAVKHHPEYGASLMEPLKSLNTILPMVRSHHERFDGGGYPDSLACDDIPIGARILAVADAYSTMVTGRAYRAAISSESALEELVRCSGTQFDPDVIAVMVKLVRRA